MTKLFRAAPDLLEEFKQFLPDHSAQGQADAAAAAQQRAAAQAKAAGAAAAPPGARPVGAAAAAGPVRQVPAEDSASVAAAKRKRAGAQAEKQPEPAPPAPLPAGPAGRSRQQPGKRVGKGAAAGVKDPVAVAQQSNARYEGIIASQPAYPQPILSYLPPGYTLPGFGGTASVSQVPPPSAQMTNEERLFFDRVADFIDDKFTYYEFLKLLNLYTQDIIDLPTLVSRAWLFIGSAPDLWIDFRHLVGWQDGHSVNGRTIENGEWIVENIPAVEKKGPDLSRAESAGPSYRKLPPSVSLFPCFVHLKHTTDVAFACLQEINMQCSGRDKLCWEVLNDEWVSVMSLGSEEVFLAHRKNPFEEALHRSEEERHEYDFHIEANLRTIALLEPIAAKIATMSPKERETFRLKPGLGGQSKSLYQRIIKKVYGKEIGREVIAALHENPCVSVPIVLARLKQKDEEWKRALREWNRVWREVDAKNFYRSLDVSRDLVPLNSGVQELIFYYLCSIKASLSKRKTSVTSTLNPSSLRSKSSDGLKCRNRLPHRYLIDHLRLLISSLTLSPTKPFSSTLSSYSFRTSTEHQAITPWRKEIESKPSFVPLLHWFSLYLYRFSMPCSLQYKMMTIQVPFPKTTCPIQLLLQSMARLLRPMAEGQDP